MAQKKNYSRYFIILQEEEKGYALATDKIPTGYTKLEVKNEKCKISFYVQNLKKEMEPYYMALICDKKGVKNLIKIGLMNIDDHGRAECSFEYPIQNILNTGIAMDKIIGAAVVKFQGESISSVMSGFMVTEIPNWKVYDMLPLQAVIAEKENIMEEPTQMEEIIEEIPEENNKYKEYEDMIEEIKEENVPEQELEGDMLQTDGVNENIEIPEEEINDTTENLREEEFRNDKYKEEKQYTPIDINLEEKNPEDRSKEFPLGSAGEFFKGIVGKFEEIKDICVEIKRCKWFKIPARSLESMSDASDYNRYTIVSYPMIGYYPYIKKYYHYIMGLKYDKTGKMKYLIYGIPGNKSITEQPFGGKSGFVTWVPQNIMEDKDDSLGYWLMFYDFRNSTIVVPIK